MAMNDQEFARWQRQGEALKAHIESRSDSAKREAARHGPRAVELAELEHRVGLAELRLRSIAQFGIDAGRTMTPGEGASFDEAMIEISALKRQIADIIR